MKLKRNFEGNPESIRAGRSVAEALLGAIVILESLRHVSQTQALTVTVFTSAGFPRAVVVDLDMKSVFPPDALDFEHVHRMIAVQTVPESILHQRLHQHRRYRSIFRNGIHQPSNLQAAAETHLLDVDILV